MSEGPPLTGGGWRERLAQLPGGAWLWLGALLVVGVVLVAVTSARVPASVVGAGEPAAEGAEAANALADPPAPDPEPEVPAAIAQPPAVVPAAPVAAPSPADAGVLSPQVRITFKTYPPRRASVTWGGERLGFTTGGKPLVVERPRDSGPMDVVIRAPGYVPVHTRAYTFDDAVIDVRITPNDKKDTLYGYQQPLPPESPDAGASL